jgi:hypothetical protein
MVMLRALLDASLVATAQRILGLVERALAANYLVADRSGDAVNFETIAGGAAEIHVIVPQNGLIAHANRFCARAFRPDSHANPMHARTTAASFVTDVLRSPLPAPGRGLHALPAVPRAFEHVPREMPLRAPRPAVHVHAGLRGTHRSAAL